ncbi:Major facilitator superfamily domain-containing protein 9-like Protein [Tribolium castaneum]|uniref:Major facilitator superfamily domain-containing protein 9-like Protein n=2 Tax=Tribolium castaneum TaxID=7070 RepID=D6X442_TRICA|nr:Major facilitator superfamily domain-containing protein 9-like Protein [Tribolium castaneum]
MLLPILYAVSTLDALAFALVITTINPYAFSLGGTQFYLGVLGSLAALINLFWNPIVGSLSDSLGRKKILLLCLAFVFVGNLLATLFSSLTVLFISRILSTFGTQIAILIKSLLDDKIKTKETKMAAIYRMQAIGGIAFISGALIGGHLSEHANGFRITFALISTMVAVNFALICLIPDVHTTEKKAVPTLQIATELKNAAANLTKVNWPKYWDLFTMKLIVDFVMNVMQFNLGLILQQRFGVSGKLFGYVFAIASVVSIATSLAMSKAQKSLYKNDISGLQRLKHGFLLLMLACLGLGLSPNVILFCLFLMPTSVTRVLFESTFTEIILARASPQEKGSIMGTFETTLSLGGLTAPLISGIVSDFWGEMYCILMCAVPLVLGTGLIYLQKSKTQ